MVPSAVLGIMCAVAGHGLQISKGRWFFLRFPASEEYCDGTKRRAWYHVRGGRARFSNIQTKLLTLPPIGLIFDESHFWITGTQSYRLAVFLGKKHV